VFGLRIPERRERSPVWRVAARRAQNRAHEGSGCDPAEDKVMDEPLAAWARAILFKELGQVYISKELAETIEDISRRLRANKPVTLGEVDWVEEQLRATPGYTEMTARELLDQRLKTPKSLMGCEVDRKKDE